MQTATRYLCLSGTHLGPAAERSCIFCINAVAVADRHLIEITWRLMVCGPWYSTATSWSTWTQGSEKRTSNALCQELRSSVVKKRDVPLPYFLSTQMTVQGDLYYARECSDNGIYCSLPTQSTKWSSCFELLNGMESCFVKPFPRQGVCQVFFVSWLLTGSTSFLLQG